MYAGPVEMLECWPGDYILTTSVRRAIQTGRPQILSGYRPLDNRHATSAHPNFISIMTLFYPISLFEPSHWLDLGMVVQAPQLRVHFFFRGDATSILTTTQLHDYVPYSKRISLPLQIVDL